MFRLLRGIYSQNPDLQHAGGFFLRWAADNYVAASAMALRRELDGRKGSENLYHLLREIRAHPTVICRARFRNTWNGLQNEYYNADREFDQMPIIKVAADPDADHIDPASVDDDIRKLMSEDEVLDHVETTFAHRAPVRQDAEVPTFGDLHHAIEVVREVFGRYYLILTHKALVFFEPTAQYNVFEPFRSPWIPDPERFDYGQCE